MKTNQEQALATIRIVGTFSAIAYEVNQERYVVYCGEKIGSDICLQDFSGESLEEGACTLLGMFCAALKHGWDPTDDFHYPSMPSFARGLFDRLVDQGLDSEDRKGLLVDFFAWLMLTGKGGLPSCCLSEELLNQHADRLSKVNNVTEMELKLLPWLKTWVFSQND